MACRIAAAVTSWRCPLRHARADVLAQVGGGHGVGVGMLAPAEQGAHLILGHLLAFQAGQVHALAGPLPRRVPLSAVLASPERLYI